MEEQQTLGELIQQTYDWLVAAKYSKGTVYSFECSGQCSDSSAATILCGRWTHGITESG